jgi:hypothetical protein
VVVVRLEPEKASDPDEVRLWATVLMGQLTTAELPLYGGDEWSEAPEPVRLASAVRAAEAWRESCDPHRLAVDVEAELEAHRRADERDYDGWRAIARRVRALANEPTHAELQQRRSA